jgi:hypothetical protein
MAEPHPKGKQPSAPSKPSRLKNQVNPESIPDDVASEHASFQVPDSQAVVPETQCGDSEHLAHTMEGVSQYSNLPLSPNTAALLDWSTIKKSTETIDASPIAVTFLSKDRTLDRVASAPEVPFSFEQPKKLVTLSQLEPKSKFTYARSQPIVKSIAVPKVTADALHQTAISEYIGDHLCTGFSDIS